MGYGLYSYSGIGIVKDDHSGSGIGAIVGCCVPTFAEWFKQLLGERSESEFARATGTSQPSVNRAVKGKDVPLGHLEKWADGLGLVGSERERFIAQGRAAKGVKSKRLGGIYSDERDRADRAEEALLTLVAALETLEKRGDLGFKIPKSARQTAEAIRKMRGT